MAKQVRTAASDLVSVTEIARRFSAINGYDIAPQGVSNWLLRYSDFADARKATPHHEQVVNNRRLYSWEKFSAWGRRNGFLVTERRRIYDDMMFDITEHYVKVS